MECEPEHEALEMNMACITNELSDLVIGRATPGSNGNVIISGRPLIVPIQDHSYQFISSVDQLLSAQLDPYHRNMEMGMNAARPRSQSFDFNAHPSMQPMPIAPNARYKRRASSADHMDGHALLCAAFEKSTGTPESHMSCSQMNKRGGVNGMRRKYSRLEAKQTVDYDSVVIDLKAIGLSTSNTENNDVLRLFGLFRKFHHYLNDKISFAAEPGPVPLTKPIPFFPRTMNVQTQIKHSIHKLNFFCFRLFEKLDEHKLADRDKYFECYRSVSMLRKMGKQFEPFKEAELEHKNGVFVNSFGAAQAKNLEILLSQLIGKIRDCNIFVQVYLISVKNNAETDASPSIETLKKAVAIAGAMKNNIKTINSEKKNDFEPFKMVPIEENCDKDRFTQNDSNGEGIADVAIVPASDLNSRGGRFLGV